MQSLTKYSWVTAAVILIVGFLLLYAGAVDYGGGFSSLFRWPLVFDMVKQMDKLDAEKPWGIWLGLPAPYRCVLEADTVGAKCHCLFENGHILAEITKYDYGNLLEMDVVEYTLTGREWFEFVDATYTFAREAGQTRITRTSSYRSSLRPRWYWEPLESWGIAEEHAFVLASLRKNLAEHTGAAAGAE